MSQLLINKYLGDLATFKKVSTYANRGQDRSRQHYRLGFKQIQRTLQTRIGTGKAARKITKEAFFHYCYAVLHDPVYREKYAQNLKREFPRIPFYPNFWQWAEWGRTLMDLHIGYEAV